MKLKSLEIIVHQIENICGYLQSGQNEKNGEVDHDNHVDISLVENLADVADG